MNTINFINNTTNFTGIRKNNKKAENKNNNSESNKMTMLPAIVLSSAILTNITPANFSNNKSDSYYINKDNTEIVDIDTISKDISSTKNFVNEEDGTVYIIPYLPKIKIAKAMPQTNLVANDL